MRIQNEHLEWQRCLDQELYEKKNLVFGKIVQNISLEKNKSCANFCRVL